MNDHTEITADMVERGALALDSEPWQGVLEAARVAIRRQEY